MTPDDVRALPVVVDVPTAGRAFGLGRDASYELARTGQLPVPVLRLGRRLVVTRASLLAALGVADTYTGPSNAAAAQVRTAAAETESAGAR